MRFFVQLRTSLKTAVRNLPPKYILVWMIQCCRRTEYENGAVLHPFAIILLAIHSASTRLRF